MSLLTLDLLQGILLISAFPLQRSTQYSLSCCLQTPCYAINVSLYLALYLVFIIFVNAELFRQSSALLVGTRACVPDHFRWSVSRDTLSTPVHCISRHVESNLPSRWLIACLPERGRGHFGLYSLPLRPWHALYP